MISSVPGAYGVPTVYAQDCSGAPLIGSPMWISCLATDSVGVNNPNNGPTILQNGPIGASSYNPAPPKGRIIFEGYGISNGPQDLITFGDSDNGTKLFSQGGIRPQADAGDCAISSDNAANFTTWGLAFRCTTSISNYISSLPDGSDWLEQLTATSKSFKVPNIVLSNGNPATNPPFTITVPTPTAARTLAITDPGGTASFGLSLGSTTITGPTSVSKSSCVVSASSAIPNVTSSNSLIVTPQASLSASGYAGLTFDAYVSSPGMVKLEVCNTTANAITPTGMNFIVKAF